MVETIGDCNVDCIDDANIPVDIWLLQADNKDVADKYRCKIGQWVLHANNYMPRTGECSGTYIFVSDNKDELLEIIKTKIIPLYQTALNILNDMVVGKSTNLYYWSNKWN